MGRRAIVGALLCSLVMALAAGPADAAGTHDARQVAQAKKGLLVLSDMPKGWTSSKSSDSTPPTPGAAQLASCLGVPIGVINDVPPTAYSPEFASKNSLESVDDNVSVYPSAQAARTDFAAFAGSKAPACLSANLNGPSKTGLESSFGAGVSIGTIDVTRTPAADYAPHTTNITIFFPVTTNGATHNVESTEIVFVKGSEEQTVTTYSFQPPFPTSLARQLTKVADARI